MTNQEYALLPCNGLDKPYGMLSREFALAVLDSVGGELICPVFAHRAPARYRDAVARLPLLVIDGCATRCASRLAAEQEWKVERKLQLTEAAKAAGVAVEEALIPGPLGLAFCRELVDGLLREDREQTVEAAPAADFSSPVEYGEFTHDKFVFRVPVEGYYFNENDCWVRVSGNRARVGISDYMQQNLSDILYCTPPEVGAGIDQFGEAGEVESPKATFEVVSPVSGRVVAVNREAVEKPELINSSPYEKGWIVELELSDFKSDRELLMDGVQYLDLLRKKVVDHKG